MVLSPTNLNLNEAIHPGLILGESEPAKAREPRLYTYTAQPAVSRAMTASYMGVCVGWMEASLRAR